MHPFALLETINSTCSPSLKTLIIISTSPFDLLNNIKIPWKIIIHGTYKRAIKKQVLSPAIFIHPYYIYENSDDN